MATIDLGKIKQVWRGTYNNGTAYAVDDLVEYTDTAITSSYICTTASTGNAPSSGGTAHGSWAYVAKGAAGTPTTTRGDIIYRGASADARLAKGTAGHYLKQGANDPEWASVATDCVKVASGTASSDGDTVITVDNVFTTDYDLYKMYFWWRENAWTKVQLIKSDGTHISTNDYDWIGTYSNRNRSTNAENTDSYGGDSTDYIALNYWNGHDDIPAVSEMTFFRPMDANTHPSGLMNSQAHSGTTQYVQNGSWSYVGTVMAIRGFKLIAESNSFNSSTGAGECHYVVYGYKW